MADPDGDLTPGVRVGRYQVLAALGEGGMGAAMLGRADDDTPVVLKRQRYPNDDARLREEARIGMRLQHRGIVQTLDLVEHAGRPVLVLAFISGTSLARLAAEGAVPPHVVAHIGSEIGAALDAIHHAANEHGEPLGMLHRDVTPANIIVGHDGHARLIDLGIARWSESAVPRTEPGLVRGTWRYVAPEVFSEGYYSHASDLWSLGMTCLEAALGEKPFAALRLPEFVARMCGAPAIDDKLRARLDPRLARALATLLALDPDDRPLRGLLAGELFAAADQDADGGAEVQARVRSVVGGPEASLKGGGGVRQLQVLARDAYCASPDARLAPTRVFDKPGAVRISSGEGEEAETAMVRDASFLDGDTVAQDDDEKATVRDASFLDGDTVAQDDDESARTLATLSSSRAATAVETEFDAPTVRLVSPRLPPPLRPRSEPQPQVTAVGTGRHRPRRVLLVAAAIAALALFFAGGIAVGRLGRVSAPAPAAPPSDR